ncbi:ImcF-related family protein [Rhodovulum euryhalinum]|uniref:Type VI secretion system (T6SS) protein DotU n=1 Tax=Rhodovulum euryhalinum TaxID=35805 RepID=A0A4R2KAM5_9RHOB|nr:ImcF-related family protein [Rhodovulum euryhalinum]TCO70521.1 type VI secretion system (T6SS) protein DotU [Rhodovulum euryhalinum]
MAGWRGQARTVLPGGGPRGPDDPGRFPRLAAPVLGFLDGMAVRAGREADLLAEARARLDRFEAAAQAEGVRAEAVRPARYALAMLIDQKARSLPGLSVRRWSALAARSLFDGRDISADRVRGFRETALAEGPDYADLARFLGDLLDRAEAERRGGRRRRRSAWPLWAGGGAVALVLALAAYAVALEWRFQARLGAQFAEEALVIGLDRPAIGTDLGARLDRLAAAVGRVEAATAAAPLGGRLAVGPFDAAGRARAEYAGAVAHHLPGAMAAAVAEVLATEGDGLALYDTLRAWSILTGEAAWSTAYLAGWIGALGADDPALAALVPHVAALPGPPGTLPAQDAELLAQARGFAREAGEPERAWLELRRSEGAAALAPWRGDRAVPGLADVVLRRSGRAMDAPLPGVFTAAGWDWARDYGAGLAVQTARAVAPDLLGTVPPQVNDAPDKVMDVLHDETLAHWRDYLADLRVRPFGDRDASVRISGLLAAPNSPLTRLLREVWAQAGGADRRRGHDRQLRLATVFGPTIQYVEAGKMAEIAALFASLNVALGAMGEGDEAAAERLMSVQDRAASVEALKTAPLVVVQIVEDVLAQTSAAHADILTNPVTRRWQAAVLPLCKRTVEGRYPFAEGAPADTADFAELFGPGGALQGFYAGTLAPYLDTSARPWRWKPEARLAGLSPDSAAFFERALTAAGGFFGADGGFGAAMTLATLAERGQAVMAVGGQGVPLSAAAAAERLAWPGPVPQQGAEVSFRGEAGALTLAEPGPWGLLQLLDGVRVRRRDEGRRFLVDFRTATGRIFVEISFEAALNPLSARPLLQGLACPTTL